MATNDTLAGLFSMVKTDCEKRFYEREMDGEIFSPNFPNETGHSANCSWELKSPDDAKNYVLQFSIRYHNLPHAATADSGKVDCVAQLTVNEKPVNCSAYFNPSVQCRLYYSSFVCENTVRNMIENPTSKCKEFLAYNQTMFPIEVTYVSNDSESDFDTATKTGFSSHYEFMECTQEPTTTAASVILATSVIMITDTITARDVENTEGQSSRDTEAVFHVAIWEPTTTAASVILATSVIMITDTITARDAENTVTQSSRDTEAVSHGAIWSTSGEPSQVNVSMIVAISVMGVILLALVVAVICIRKRKHCNAFQTPPIREEMPNPIYQSQGPGCSYANVPNQSRANNRTLEPMNHGEVGGATGSSQSDEAENPYMTIDTQADGAVNSAANQPAGEAVHSPKESVENILYWARE